MKPNTTKRHAASGRDRSVMTQSTAVAAITNELRPRATPDVFDALRGAQRTALVNLLNETARRVGTPGTPSLALLRSLYTEVRTGRDPNGKPVTIVTRPQREEWLARHWLVPQAGGWARQADDISFAQETRLRSFKTNNAHIAAALRGLVKKFPDLLGMLQGLQDGDPEIIAMASKPFKADDLRRWILVYDELGHSGALQAMLKKEDNISVVVEYLMKNAKELATDLRSLKSRISRNTSGRAQRLRGRREAQTKMVRTAIRDYSGIALVVESSRRRWKPKRRPHFTPPAPVEIPAARVGQVLRFSGTTSRPWGVPPVSAVVDLMGFPPIAQSTVVRVPPRAWKDEFHPEARVGDGPSNWIPSGFVPMRLPASDWEQMKEDAAYYSARLMGNLDIVPITSGGLPTRERLVELWESTKPGIVDNAMRVVQERAVDSTHARLLRRLWHGPAPVEQHWVMIALTRYNSTISGGAPGEDALDLRDFQDEPYRLSDAFDEALVELKGLFTRSGVSENPGHYEDALASTVRDGFLAPGSVDAALSWLCSTLAEILTRPAPTIDGLPLLDHEEPVEIDALAYLRNRKTRREYERKLERVVDWWKQCALSADDQPPKPAPPQRRKKCPECSRFRIFQQSFGKNMILSESEFLRFQDQIHPECKKGDGPPKPNKKPYKHKGNGQKAQGRRVAAAARAGGDVRPMEPQREPPTDLPPAPEPVQGIAIPTATPIGVPIAGPAFEAMRGAPPRGHALASGVCNTAPNAPPAQPAAPSAPIAPGPVVPYDPNAPKDTPTPPPAAPCPDPAPPGPHVAPGKPMPPEIIRPLFQGQDGARGAFYSWYSKLGQPYEVLPGRSVHRHVQQGFDTYQPVLDLTYGATALSLGMSKLGRVLPWCLRFPLTVFGVGTALGMFLCANRLAIRPLLENDLDGNATCTATRWRVEVSDPVDGPMMDVRPFTQHGDPLLAQSVGVRLRVYRKDYRSYTIWSYIRALFVGDEGEKCIVDTVCEAHNVYANFRNPSTHDPLTLERYTSVILKQLDQERQLNHPTLARHVISHSAWLIMGLLCSSAAEAILTPSECLNGVPTRL